MMTTTTNLSADVLRLISRRDLPPYVAIHNYKNGNEIVKSIIVDRRADYRKLLKLSVDVLNNLSTKTVQDICAVLIEHEWNTRCGNEGDMSYNILENTVHTIIIELEKDLTRRLNNKQKPKGGNVVTLRRGISYNQSNGKLYISGLRISDSGYDRFDVDITDNKSLKKYIMEQILPIGNWRQYVINGTGETTISFV